MKTNHINNRQAFLYKHTVPSGCFLCFGEKVVSDSDHDTEFYVYSVDDDSLGHLLTDYPNIASLIYGYYSGR